LMRPSSREIFNLIRAVTDPYPGAFTDVDGSRLMVWWAEPGTPATAGKRGRPGEVLSVSPLVIATGDGVLELTRTEWRGAVPELRAGRVI
jgi:methionyl-tRNA formyltransferase